MPDENLNFSGTGAPAGSITRTGYTAPALYSRWFFVGIVLGSPSFVRFFTANCALGGILVARITL